MDKKKSTAAGKAGGAGKAEHGSASSKDTSSRRRANLRMVQNVPLIWLDNSIDEKNVDCQNTIVQLQHVANTVNTFSDADECVDFLTDRYDQKTIMIISDALCQKTVPLIYDINQLNTIFILCKNKTRYEEWSKNWPKIKGVFAEVALICNALQQAARQSEHDSISISFMVMDDNLAKKSLDQLDCSYMYTQILKEILLSVEFEQEHIKEFSDYCRNVVAETESEIMSINRFEEQYRNKTPIWWYTYQCFLYPMVNRALRLMDTDILITVGFFIADLHRNIEQLHATQSSRHHTSTALTVYRGQGMSETDFEKMRQTKDGLLSFNNFLSTSTDRDISVAFAESNQSNPDLVGILFVMTIDPSQSTVPFASISNVSHFEGEDEVIFSMHTVFRICDIIPMDKTNRLFQVDLTLTSDNDKDLCALTERIRKETEKYTGWYRLGELLIDMGQTEKAQQVFEAILERTTDENEKGKLYDRLGVTKHGQNEYPEAVAFFEKSLEIESRALAPNHSNLAASWHNIGLVYQSMGDYSKALSSYEKALAIAQQSLLPNDSDLAITYNNIGNVYCSMSEHPKALSFYEKAHAIWQKSFPSNHPNLAASYNNIGIVYGKMGEHSNSLSYKEKALAIKQKSLPPNHPSFGNSYNSIGATYEKMGEYSKALSYYYKALAIRQQSLPLNHPDSAASYNNIGKMYAEMGDYSKARSFYERAVDNAQHSLPSNHSDLQGYRNNLYRIKKKL